MEFQTTNHLPMKLMEADELLTRNSAVRAKAQPQTDVSLEAGRAVYEEWRKAGGYNCPKADDAFIHRLFSAMLAKS